MFNQSYLLTVMQMESTMRLNNKNLKHLQNTWTKMTDKTKCWALCLGTGALLHYCSKYNVCNPCDSYLKYTITRSQIFENKYIPFYFNNEYNFNDSSND